MTSENPGRSIAQEALDSKNSAQLLSSDHAELDELLQALVASFGQGDPAEVFARLDLFWARLAMHIRAEHLHLFPLILDASDEAQGPSVSDAIKLLRSDHDFFMKELARAVKLMRAAGGNSETIKEVCEIIAMVTARLEQHNKIEEETIYHLPSRLLTISQQTVLLTDIHRELQNTPSRFTELNDQTG